MTASSQSVDRWSCLDESIALIQARRYREAEASLRHLLSVEPQFIEATYHLVRLLIGQRRYADAIAVLEPATAPVADRQGPNRVGELAHLALELAQRGVNEAMPLLQRITGQVPDDIAVNCQAGDALVALGEQAAAAPYFERAASGQPASGDKWQWFYQSTALIRLDRFAEAEVSLRHALRLEPRFIEATYRLVRLLIDQGRYAEAVAALEPATEPVSDRVGELAPLALELAQRGVREALPLLQRIVEQLPDNIVVNCHVGDALVAFGERAAAAPYFQRAASGQPTGEDNWQWLCKSTALIRLDRPAEAEASLRHLLSVEPQFIEATYHLVRLLIDCGRYAQAAAALEAASVPVTDQQGPSRVGELAHLALELGQRGVKEVMPLLRSIAAQVPDAIVVNCQVGDALVAFGERAAAAPYFERAASGQPAGGDKWQWICKSTALVRLERPAEAEASLRHLLTLEINDIDATSRLVRLLIDQRRYGQAVAALEPAIASTANRQGSNRVGELATSAFELAQRGVKEGLPLLQRIVAQVPDDIVVNCQVGDVLVAHSDPVAAAPYFERAASGQLTGEDKWQRLYQSIALIRIDRPAEAEASLRHLLRVEPQLIEATCHLVQLLIDGGRYAEAIASLEPAAAPVTGRPGPNRVGELAPLVFEFARRGVKEAMPLLQRIVAQVPDDIVVNCQVGDALVAFGERAAAAPYFERAASGQPTGIDKWQWIYKSNALIRLDRPAEAEAALRRLLTLEINDVDATSVLVRLLIDHNRLEEAYRILASAVGPAKERSPASFATLALELAIRGQRGADDLLQYLVKIKSRDAKALRDIANAAYWIGAADRAIDYIARSRAVADTPSLRIDDALMLPFILSTADEADRWVGRFRAKIAELSNSGIQITNPLETIVRPPHYPFFCYGINTRELYREAGTAWQTVYPDLHWTAPHCEAWKDSPARPRLRVGFLTQPTFPLVWGIAKELDRRRFEVVHLYQRSDPLTRSCPWTGAADRHVAVPEHDVKAAQRVVADQALDVLIHMPYTNIRYFLSHARLAPIQCVLCEPCYTDGLANLDYYISWEPAEPKPLDHWYNCAVALMTRAPYWVERDYTKPVELQRKDFDLPPNARWYLCPNNPIKMHPRFDIFLAKILSADPEGIVVLLRGSWPMPRMVEQRIRTALGPLADRVHMLPSLSEKRAHALLLLADAVLDSWPLGGMSSSFAAIHGGIPTVTLPADVPFGRWMASLYEAMGVTDLIANDEADFVRLAVRLANNPQWRGDISRRIRASNGIFVEDHLAVREIETFLVAAVVAARRGEQPRSWRDGGFADGSNSSMRLEDIPAE